MGRYPGLGRDMVEDGRALDVFYLRRHGLLAPGRSSTMRWLRNDVEVASIGTRAVEGAIILSYRHCGYGEDWQNVEQRVPLVWTPCHFGGSRPWFRCAVYRSGVYCGRRVAKLYGHGKLFACRYCYDLAYENQRENWGFRALRKAQKIRERLGGSLCIDDFPPEKPKGMHWRTYERLMAQLDAAEMRTNEYTVVLARRLGRRS